MNVWKPTPVSETPEIKLTNWQVYEVPSLKEGEYDKHLVGYNLTEGAGRVSSKLINYDEASRCFTTRSGRVYQLEGSSGYNGDALYTWSNWLFLNKIDPKHVNIISEAYEPKN